MNDVEWLQFSARFPVLTKSDRVKALLREQAIVKYVPAREILYRDGDDCAYLPMVVSGELSLTKRAETGRSIVLYRVTSGESCILSTLSIVTSHAFPADAMTEEAATVVLVPASAVRTLINEDHAWRDFAFSVYHDRLADLILLVEEIVFARLDGRLAEYLLAAAPENVLERTHAEIAATLGSSREVVSRLLKEWERREILVLGRGRITLVDRAFLAASAGNRDRGAT